MSAIIIKFPRAARFRTKAAQVKLNKVFKRIKSDEPDMSDKKAFKLAVLFLRFEERSAQLHKDRGTASASIDMNLVLAGAAEAVRALQAAKERSRA